MKTDLDLLTLLKEQYAASVTDGKSIYPGLTALISEMYHVMDIITLREKHRLLEILDDNKPKEIYDAFHFFEPFMAAKRLAFLEGVITVGICDVRPQ